jgi:hypothetical protein
VDKEGSTVSANVAAAMTATTTDCSRDKDMEGAAQGDRMMVRESSATNRRAAAVHAGAELRDAIATNAAVSELRGSCRTWICRSTDVGCQCGTTDATRISRSTKLQPGSWGSVHAARSGTATIIHNGTAVVWRSRTTSTAGLGPGNTKTGRPSKPLCNGSTRGTREGAQSRARAGHSSEHVN